MVGDPIANLINGLKNASIGKKDIFSAPYSKLKENILSVLKKEGFISDFEVKGKDVKKHLDVSLKYEAGVPAIHGVRRVSKFSRRIYKGIKDIFPVKNNYGISVISTPQGVMSDREAKKAKVGGEILFEIW
ncbi:30S ribosomal protein S8 [Candidatus Nomurabacteria bacterium]|nr:30S ribosomal protein S8 [Candidatus Nomurabacteria bacterium]